MTSRCAKNISSTPGCALCLFFMSLLHFDVIYDLLLNRHTATWNDDKYNDDDYDGDDVDDAGKEDDNGMMIKKMILMMTTKMTMTRVKMMMRT